MTDNADLKDEAAEPFRNIRKQLQEAVADKLNVDLNSVAFMIGPDPGDPDVVQVVFALTADALKSVEELEQKRIDDEFERMMTGSDIIDTATEVTSEPLDLWEDD